jgi:hypothetical protein
MVASAQSATAQSAIGTSSTSGAASASRGQRAWLTNPASTPILCAPRDAPIAGQRDGRSGMLDSIRAPGASRAAWIV